MHTTTIRSILVIQAENGFALLPFALGEIGDVLHLAALGDALLAQRGDGVPRGHVVHVQREGLLALDALDEGVVDEEVHAAMSGAFGLRGVALPQRVVVLLEMDLAVGPAVAVLHLLLEVEHALVQVAPAGVLP